MEKDKRNLPTDFTREMINLDETAEWSKLDIEKNIQEPQKTVQTQKPVQTQKSEQARKPVQAQKPAPTKKTVQAAKTTPSRPKQSKPVENRKTQTKPAQRRPGQSKGVQSRTAQKRPEQKRPTRNKPLPQNRSEEKENGLLAFLKEWSMLEKMMLITGVAAIFLVCIILGVVSSENTVKKQIAAMAPIGEEMEEIGVAGTDTLLAVADSRRSMIEMANAQKYEYEEKEYGVDNQVEVSMSLTSVQKDLKIKFVNKKTKKLVPHIKFLVEIQDANGNVYEMQDDDTDGIIYIKSMEPGKTKVTMLNVTGDKSITFSPEPQTVTVKEKIDYKKIDVSDEVKTEGEVDASKEDTGKQEQEEVGLTDTVEWVESTATEIGNGGYNAIGKDSITDPTATANIATGPVAMDEIIIVGPSEPTEETTEEGSTEEESEEPSSETEPTPTPTAEPTPHPATQDTKTKLKSKDGKQVYVKKSDGSYKEAVYADYFTYSEFFVAGDKQYRYTGWQNLNGKTYFFDKNGNKVTGDQVIKGAKYSFTSDGALITGSGVMGIDVSKWNGNIDWNAVKASGVSYVIIRCGYRGSSTGALIEDPKFKTNIQGATNAGLKVGIYFFSQAVNEVEAVEEASMTIQLIKNYKISYPVFLDVEPSGGRADAIDKSMRTKVIHAYCQTIKNSGYTPGVYANKTWLESKMNTGEFGAYKIWLAQYNTAPTYSGRIDLWQYTSKGNVKGIGGHTDLNLSYLGY